MKAVVAAAILLALASIAYAGYGAGNPRLSKLYSSFMAPCCYGGDLTLHNSQAASDLRAQIATWVNEGKSDGEIRDILVAQYGKRILAVPEGSAHTWLFSAPGFFLVLGMLVVAFVLKRMRRTETESVAQPGP
ncbi:MAG TPA: cytochrome c-type biogenesis protein CcmH [Candidatus Krumholzibacteria bacterium]|nr:cytochrome c-type biogenesis protein CcmH [Candidatus Krumholzibacteria bacterium]